MRVIKCDLCKRNIKEKPVIAGIGLLNQIELCKKCGAPILKFLRKYKFIQKEKSKK